MKLISFLYFLPAIFAFLGPIMLVFKKKVTSPQWLGALFQILIGIVMVLYSLYFNLNIYGEFFLSMLYNMLSLMYPMIFYLYVCHLTEPSGVTKAHRQYLLIPLIMMMMMVLLALIVGRDGYRYYLEEALYLGNRNFTNSITFNSLVAVNFYGFSLFLFIELLVVSLFSMRHLVIYSKQLNEAGLNYYPWIHSCLGVRIAFVVVDLLMVLLGIDLIFSFHTLGLAITISLLSCLLQIYLGVYIYFADFSVEDILRHKYVESCDKNFSHTVITQVESMLRVQERMEDYVERREAFCNPELTCVRLADMFDTTPEDLINLLQTERGCSFAEYIDGLRINKAVNMILDRCRTEAGEIDKSRINNTKIIEEIAYLCGYNSLSSFYLGFSKVMNQSFSSWLAE